MALDVPETPSAAKSSAPFTSFVHGLTHMNKNTIIVGIVLGVIAISFSMGTSVHKSLPVEQAAASLAPEALALIDKRLQDSQNYDAAADRLVQAQKDEQQAIKDMTSAERAAISRENLLCTDFQLRWDNTQKKAVADVNCPLF